MANWIPTDYYANGYQGYMPPPVVRVGRASKKPLLNLSRLSAGQKRQVWAALQQDAPHVAQAITEMKPIVDLYDGETLVEIADLPPSVLALTGKTR